MANELVLGLGMNPETVAAMRIETVRYWYNAARAREAALLEEQKRKQGL